MPSAFITGGSGFVGGRLLERLEHDGWDVRALARSDAASERVRSLGAEPIAGDLDDLVALRAGADGVDAVIHCAAKADDWGDPAEFDFPFFAASRILPVKGHGAPRLLARAVDGR